MSTFTITRIDSIIASVQFTPSAGQQICGSGVNIPTTSTPVPRDLRMVMVTSNNASAVYIGFDSSVSPTNYSLIAEPNAGGTEVDCGGNVPVYISASGLTKVVYAQ